MKRISSFIKTNAGFGIVEALVAIAAAGIIITLVLGLFRTTNKTYDITTDRIVRLQEARGALNTIKKDFQSCLISSAFFGKANKVAIRDGYPENKDFVSFNLVQLEKQENGQVLAPANVAYELKPIGGPDFPLFELEKTIITGDEKKTRLIPGSAYAGLKFSYRKPSRGITSWVDSWDHSYTPEQVKINLWVDEGSGRNQLYQLETVVNLGGGL